MSSSGVVYAGSVTPDTSVGAKIETEITTQGTLKSYILDRAKNWGALSWPLKEFLSGIQDTYEVVIDILHDIDITGLPGATVYVGWGISADEMLSTDPPRYKELLNVRTGK